MINLPLVLYCQILRSFDGLKIIPLSIRGIISMVSQQESPYLYFIYIIDKKQNFISKIIIVLKEKKFKKRNLWRI